MRGDFAVGSYKMRLMGVIEAAPSIRAGCRQVGVHASTYYRWRQRVARFGPEGLMPAEGQRRLSPNRVRLESEVVALALANPPWGPRRLFFELTGRGIGVGSVSGVWRILVAHGLNTRRARWAVMTAARGLTEAHLDPGSRKWRENWIGQLDAEIPGDLVQMDCFQLGRLKEARLGVRKQPAMVWQYTAIDVASSFVWASVHSTVHNPSSTHTTALAHQVAADLAHWGWTLKAVTTDRGTEFRNQAFTNTITTHGAQHRLIAPGRPQTNGKVEQVQDTILRECWQPSFVGYVQPSITGARIDLTQFLHYYNHHRPHGGKWNNGTPPAQIIIPNTGNQP